MVNAMSNICWLLGQFGLWASKDSVESTQVQLKTYKGAFLKKILLLDQHFYVHLNDVSSFEHVDFAVTTVHSNKPYKFGKKLQVFEAYIWHKTFISC